MMATTRATTNDRQMKALTRGADEMGWRAAADLCEERGDNANAALWRARADALAFLRVLGRSNPGDGSARRVSLPSLAGTLTYRGARSIWYVWVKANSSTYFVELHPPVSSLQRADPGYLRRKAFEIASCLERYFVQVLSEGGWQDSGEGPWHNLSGARTFAEAEVGLPWRITDATGNVVAQ